MRVGAGAGTGTNTEPERANRESANLEIWFLFSPKGYNIKNKWSPNRLPTQLNWTELSGAVAGVSAQKLTRPTQFWRQGFRLAGHK